MLYNYYFLTLMLLTFLFFRVGRLDASSRQDIVLSGHFIKDEHCTFTSSIGPMGESESCSFCSTGLLLCTSKLNIAVILSVKPHAEFSVPEQQWSLSPVKELRRMSMGSG